MEKEKRCSVSLEPGSRSAIYKGRRVPVGAIEEAVLGALIEGQGRPVSAETLLRAGWDESGRRGEYQVREVIRRLRAKLREPGVIETIGGEGYRLSA